MVNTVNAIPSAYRLNVHVPTDVNFAPAVWRDGNEIGRLANKANEPREVIDAAQSTGAINPEDMLVAIQERDSIENYLNESTRKGRSKSFVSESEKVRQSVNKAINLALDKIEGKADTRLNGEHLRMNLKLGYRCAYFGDWKWKF